MSSSNQNFQKLMETANYFVLESLQAISEKINDEKSLTKEQIHELENVQKNLFNTLQSEYKDYGLLAIIKSYKKGKIAAFLLDYISSKEKIKQKLRIDDNIVIGVPTYLYLYDENPLFFKEYIKTYPYSLQDLNKSYSTYTFLEKTDLNIMGKYVFHKPILKKVRKNFLSIYFDKAENKEYKDLDKSFIIPLPDLNKIDYLDKEQLNSTNINYINGGHPNMYIRKEQYFEKIFDQKFPLIGAEMIIYFVQDILSDKISTKEELDKINFYKKNYDSIISEEQKKVFDISLSQMAFIKFGDYLTTNNNDIFIRGNNTVQKTTDNLKLIVKRFCEILDHSCFDQENQNSKKKFLENIIKIPLNKWEYHNRHLSRDNLLMIVELLKLSFLDAQKNSKTKSTLKI